MAHVTYLTLKSVGAEGERIVEGWATTPREDRVGDVVVPEGARYQLPQVLLFGHDHGAPIGSVISATVTKAGIRIRARISKGVAKADEVWTLIQDRALNSVSIGFRALKTSPLPTGGTRFDEWDWYETSIVSVPCQPDARIAVGKSIAYATEVEPIRVPAPAEAKKVTPQQAEAKAYELGGDEWQAMEAGIKAACDLLPAEVRGMVCAERSGRSPTTRDYTLSDREGREVATVKATGEVTRPGQPDKPKPQSGLTRAQRAEVVRLLDEVVAGVGKAIGQKTIEVDRKLAGAILEMADRLDSLQEAAVHDGGFWQHGKSYQRGAMVTHDGATYVATDGTSSEPGGCHSWRLIGRKGR